MSKTFRIDDTTWEAIKATHEVQAWAFGGVEEQRVREYLDESLEHMRSLDDENDIVSALSKNMGGGLPMLVIGVIACLVSRRNHD